MTLSYVTPPTRRHPNVLLYGPPKTAKTSGACSAPGLVGLLNADLPNASLHAHERHAGRLKEFSFEGLETLTDLYLGMKQQADGTTGRNFDAIVADPIGDMHRLLLEEESGRAIRPSLNQYGDIAVQIERWCRGMCKLDSFSFVMVCHEFSVKDEATGVVERLPWTGTTNTSLGSKLMAMVDIIGYTGVVYPEEGPPIYAAQFLNQDGRRGGERYSGVLGPWAPLDLDAWFQTISDTTHDTERQAA